MRSMIFAIATVASLSVANVAAEAMPAVAGAGVASAPELTLIANGCGAYRHPNAAGFCVPNRVYRPAYGYYAPRYYYPRCGIRVGPIGIGGPC